MSGTISYEDYEKIMRNKNTTERKTCDFFASRNFCGYKSQCKNKHIFEGMEIFTDGSGIWPGEPTASFLEKEKEKEKKKEALQKLFRSKQVNEPLMETDETRKRKSNEVHQETKNISNTSDNPAWLEIYKNKNIPANHFDSNGKNKNSAIYKENGSNYTDQSIMPTNKGKSSSSCSDTPPNDHLWWHQYGNTTIKYETQNQQQPLYTHNYLGNKGIYDNTKGHYKGDPMIAPSQLPHALLQKLSDYLYIPGKGNDYVPVGKGDYYTENDYYQSNYTYENKGKKPVDNKESWKGKNKNAKDSKGKNKNSNELIQKPSNYDERKSSYSLSDKSTITKTNLTSPTSQPENIMTGIYWPPVYETNSFELKIGVPKRLQPHLSKKVNNTFLYSASYGLKINEPLANCLLNILDSLPPQTIPKFLGGTYGFLQRFAPLALKTKGLYNQSFQQIVTQYEIPIDQTLRDFLSPKELLELEKKWQEIENKAEELRQQEKILEQKMELLNVREDNLNKINPSIQGLSQPNKSRKRRKLTLNDEWSEDELNKSLPGSEGFPEYQIILQSLMMEVLENTYIDCDQKIMEELYVFFGDPEFKTSTTTLPQRDDIPENIMFLRGKIPLEDITIYSYKALQFDFSTLTPIQNKIIRAGSRSVLKTFNIIHHEKRREVLRRVSHSHGFKPRNTAEAVLGIFRLLWVNNSTLKQFVEDIAQGTNNIPDLIQDEKLTITMPEKCPNSVNISDATSNSSLESISEINEGTRDQPKEILQQNDHQNFNEE